MSAACAPESSNWPPGSSEIAPPPLASKRPISAAVVLDRLPAEPRRASLEQRADAALALVGDGRQVGDIERDFLVLGADLEIRRAPCRRLRTTRPGRAGR